MKNILFALLGLFIGAAIVGTVWMVQPENELNIQSSNLPQITFQDELNHETGSLELIFSENQQDEIQSGGIEPFTKNMEADGYTVIAIFVRENEAQENSIILEGILLEDSTGLFINYSEEAYQNIDGTYRHSPGAGPRYRG